MNFKGKRVLITGAANGIGRCLAELFAAEGADLILWDIDALGVADLSSKLRLKYTPTRLIDIDCRMVDVSNKEQVDYAMKGILCGSHGFDLFPDIVINNAGIGHNGEIAEMDAKKLDKLTAVNLTGPMYISLLFVRLMAERKRGHIVNVSSGQAFFRLPTWGAYAATKIALGVFSEALGIEIKKHDVDITTVYPFMVNTGFYNGVEEAAPTTLSRLSMSLLPFYSQSPESVAKIILKAVKEKKAVEMVHPINWVGYYLNTFPGLGRVIRRVLNVFLAR